jgi:hypothetical protein
MDPAKRGRGGWNAEVAQRIMRLPVQLLTSHLMHATPLLRQSRDWRGDKVGIENACPSSASTAAVDLSDQKASISSIVILCMQPVSQPRLPTTHPSCPRGVRRSAALADMQALPQSVAEGDKVSCGPSRFQISGARRNIYCSYMNGKLSLPGARHIVVD